MTAVATSKRERKGRKETPRHSGISDEVIGPRVYEQRR
jgi:hypothetical protein